LGLQWTAKKRPSKRLIFDTIVTRIQDETTTNEIEDNEDEDDEELDDGNGSKDWKCPFVRNLIVEEFFDDEKIDSIAYDWWILGIGRDKFWGGLGEQILFTDRFNLQAIVLQRRVTGLTPYSSYILEHTLTPEGLRELHLQTDHDLETIMDEHLFELVYTQKSNLEDTIFMWSIDPTKPTARSDKTKHYMCLNLYNPLVADGTEPVDAFNLGDSDDGHGAIFN
jgi:hypothetical protein